MPRKLTFELSDYAIGLLEKEAKFLTACAKEDDVVESDGSPLVYNLDSIIEVRFTSAINQHIQDTLKELREKHD
jgi:ferric-dicitrate binding protein FerR (iron transport regulator)